jgi:ferric-dicitrate binding protein FerR (iron transport regulator)
MDGVHDSPSEAAGRWYARLRAPDCTVQDREEFEAWRASAPEHAAAYAAAERMNDALAKLAMADSRLKAMVDHAASAGATLPEEPDDAPAGEPPALRITATPILRRRLRTFVRAACILGAAGSLVAVLTTGGSEPERLAKRCHPATVEYPPPLAAARAPNDDQANL